MRLPTGPKRQTISITGSLCFLWPAFPTAQVNQAHIAPVASQENVLGAFQANPVPRALMGKRGLEKSVTTVEMRPYSFGRSRIALAVISWCLCLFSSFFLMWFKSSTFLLSIWLPMVFTSMTHS